MPLQLVTKVDSKKTTLFNLFDGGIINEESCLKLHRVVEIDDHVLALCWVQPHLLLLCPGCQHVQVNLHLCIISW